ncbi:histone deacetylase family protein [Desulfurivibrio alkaliphilus]|uniref:Histone deacetylase n=1 Tax=Desulfurivibrio alkaliphilus (strain DSM 19089 / UNIQEM U267 / AHT2) TaxID=589865 RepID=D6Z1J3_DESAT|nr:histone deacetylase [Desulfurivibrio alkaliphilus]ADH87327.1 Histone deacetylase [Desulfurivibrio alkaliphilus AHT 2]
MARKTAVLYSEVFLAHDPGPGHVESPRRLEGLYRLLDAEPQRQRFLFPEFAPADEDTLALNHDRRHIARVAKTAGSPFECLDPDTYTSARSYEAACLAAGAAVAAVDLVLGGEADNAFALVRPPGHHAEHDHTSGFCLFNNIAVAARHALKNHGLERVLIVDWDLHHGNGTQHAFYDTDQVLFFSTHQYPYFPGSGALSETGQGAGEGYTINVPLQGGQDDAAFARIFNELLIPVAEQYRPELILVSAGFDTYGGDPLGTMMVSEEGYAYLTGVLVDLAAGLCGGRLALMLEGGYDLGIMERGVLACLGELAGDQRLASARRRRLEQAAPPLRALEQAREAAKKYWTIPG